MFELTFTVFLLWGIYTFWHRIVRKHYLISSVNFGGVQMNNVRVPFVKGRDFPDTLQRWLRSKGVYKGQTDVYYIRAELRGWF